MSFAALLTTAAAATPNFFMLSPSEMERLSAAAQEAVRNQSGGIGGRYGVNMETIDNRFAEEIRAMVRQSMPVPPPALMIPPPPADDVEWGQVGRALGGGAATPEPRTPTGPMPRTDGPPPAPARPARRRPILNPEEDSDEEDANDLLPPPPPLGPAPNLSDYERAGPGFSDRYYGARTYTQRQAAMDWAMDALNARDRAAEALQDSSVNRRKIFQNARTLLQMWEQENTDVARQIQTALNNIENIAPTI
jgi:hypothetical protein